MIEFPIVFLAGLFGSSHCLGMCGPLALALGSSARNWHRNLVRQLVYTSGRIFTYAILGAMAGYAGNELQRTAPLFLHSAAVLAVVAGVFLIYQGLLVVGLLHRKPVTGGGGICLAGGILRTFILSPHWHDTFLAGLFTGLLPCGLVYAFLALAGSSGDLFSGGLLMGSFGMGTAPFMLLTGCSGSFIGHAFRQQMFRITGWCVVLMGVVSIVRGLGSAIAAGGLAQNGCPFCP